MNQLSKTGMKVVYSSSPTIKFYSIQFLQLYKRATDKDFSDFKWIFGVS